LRVALLVVVVLGVFSGVPVDLAEAQPSDPAQEEFVPIESVPPEDQLPAAPLLVTAYAIIWILVLGYLWSIWRRMSTVEHELRNLSRRSGGEPRRG
jgi:CcmD family protein